MAKITVKQLEALTAADDGKVLRDDGGLVGRVRAGARGVTVAFRFEFKLDGRKRDCVLLPCKAKGRSGGGGAAA